MGGDGDRTQVLVTDSKSSVKHKGTKTKKPGSCPGYLSEMPWEEWYEAEGREARFQKSHAERRGESVTWQRNEWGNHSADRVAGGNT